MQKNNVNTLIELFYWKWRTEFYNAVKSRQIYEDRILLQKLEEVLFFPTLKAEVLPSYHFWLRVEQTLDNFPSNIKPTTLRSLNYELDKFASAEEDYLIEQLFWVLLSFKYFPIVFRDLFTFYPKFNLKFEEIEFVYLDYWAQTPKVLASLLSELLVRDNPVRGEIFASKEERATWNDIALPPVDAQLYAEEYLHKHMIDYFLGEGTDPAFLKVINLYLNARPKVLFDCKQDLQLKGIQITEESLAEEFLGFYIFKGVSNEGLRFCVSNSNLTYKDPFKLEREVNRAEWASFTEEERKEEIQRFNTNLKELCIKVKRRAAQTHEEKLAEQKAYWIAHAKKFNYPIDSDNTTTRVPLIFF